MISALILHLDGRRERREIDATDLDVMQALVGGNVEFYPAIMGDYQADVMFHDEGRINGMAVNAFATMLLADTFDALFGTVVLLGPLDDDGNSTSFPEGLVTEGEAWERQLALYQAPPSTGCRYCGGPNH